MTIDEAIENLKYDNEINMYIYNIAPQIAEWLEDYKRLKLEVEYTNKCSECTRRKFYMQGYSAGYTKAIDNFSNTLMSRLTDAIYQKDVKGISNLINNVVKQLKAGGK